MKKNKSILITGGTGSLGKKVVSLLLKANNNQKIIIYSRDEQKQFQLQNFYKGNKKLRFFIGDVRDKQRLSFAFENVDHIIHAAAMKHVPIAEYNPFECIKTNIIGAQNIIDCAISNNVEKVIALSTDKASSPLNLYGATKLASDKLFIAANNYTGKKSKKFSVVRYGNVFGSKGSIVPQLLKNKFSVFPLTDRNMTRFNITLKQSANLVLECLKKMHGGEIFIPKISSYKILDLLKALNPKIKIKNVGPRPGEKLNEEMISVNDAKNTIETKNYYIICPKSDYFNKDKNYFLKIYKNSKSCKSNFCYTSDKNKFLTINEIKKILRNNYSDIIFS